MINFSCTCGCSAFEIHKSDSKVKCYRCRKLFVFKNGVWCGVSKKEKVIFVFKDDKCRHDFIEESIYCWKKRFGIFKFKNKKCVEGKKLNIFEQHENVILEKLKIEARWKEYLDYFRSEGVISFKKNEHFGKLRGKHIAISFHRDLKKLGVNSKLCFRKDRAFVERVD